MKFRITIPKITLNFGIRIFFAFFAPNLKQEKHTTDLKTASYMKKLFFEIDNMDIT